MPVKITCDGANISPSIVIQGIPPETQSLALVMQSEGGKSHSQKKENKLHWMVWNISPNTKFIPENTIPEGAIVGINDFWNHGYGGPYPPIGERHKYKITMYALSSSLGLPSSATKTELLKAVKSKLLDQDELVGFYQRN